jgi:hypothetical protein
MALSGVRNRRPVKPLPRGEIKKRRKKLRAELAEQQTQPQVELPGSDLIEAPDVEPYVEQGSSESRGFMGRFRRRKSDQVVDDTDRNEPPTPQVTVLGGEDPSEMSDVPPAPATEADEFMPSPPEHSTATAILEQLKGQEAAGDDDDVWLPPASGESTPWTLPEIQQSPLGGSGPWESVATSTSGVVDEAAAEGEDDFTPPVFVSEAELRSLGPADTDHSGNWVPPTLRGMAPQAGNNGAELPRRRRQEHQES